MNFLHPEFLWLAPLVAAPIIIHLMNRLRYRRVRWAAIEFLLTSEQRAVRRARLQQILLMVLRTLVLAAALTALLQPTFRGGIGKLLGGKDRIVVLTDASASMSAANAFGSAHQRAKNTVLAALGDFPRGTSAAFGAMAGPGELTSREPLGNLDTVSEMVRSSSLTDGTANIPRAIRGAAEALKRTGGGGAIWILTDGQASDWRPTDGGAWQECRSALQAAGQPRIVITKLETTAGANYSVSHVALSPAVPVEGDSPSVTATIEMRGAGGGVANVALFLDGKRVDGSAVSFPEAGKADCVFRFPKLKGGTHVGMIELGPDVIPADNRYYFTLSTEARIPVLIVDGAAGADGRPAASVFLALALQPPTREMMQRSPFAMKIVGMDGLATTPIEDYDAVFLVDVPSVSGEIADRLNSYVSGGGVMAVFPGRHTIASEWTTERFPRVGLLPSVEIFGEKKLSVTSVARRNPLTATLPLEGLDRLLIVKLFPATPGPGGDVIASTSDGRPFLIQQQLGQGRVYFFAVSALGDYSNLPATPIFLPTVYRIVLNHMLDKSGAVSRTAFAQLTMPLQPDWPRMLTPGNKVMPIEPMNADPSRATFDATSLAGVYRLTTAPAGPAPEALGADQTGPIVAAVNTPPEESDPQMISDAAVHELLPGNRVMFMPAGGGSFTGGRDQTGGGISFPFAATALAAVVAAAFLAWSIGRPSPVPEKEAESSRG